MCLRVLVLCKINMLHSQKWSNSCCCSVIYDESRGRHFGNFWEVAAEHKRDENQELDWVKKEPEMHLEKLNSGVIIRSYTMKLRNHNNPISDPRLPPLSALVCCWDLCCAFGPRFSMFCWSSRKFLVVYCPVDHLNTLKTLWTLQQRSDRYINSVMF